MNILDRLVRSLDFRLEKRYRKRYEAVFEKASQLDKQVKKSKYAYSGDGLATMHNHDFINDADFSKAFAKADPFLLARKMHWRTYINCWAAKQTLSLDGDFVECGVYKGGFARAVTSYTDFESVSTKKYYLFDTYKGLDPSISSEKEILRENELTRYEEDYYDLVVKAFRDYKNVKIVRGSIPTSLQDVQIDKVSYLSIDMNNFYAEYEAMKYFWPKLVKGGIVVLDDYGWAGYEEQKKGHDEFAKLNNFSILTLPSGQGLILK